jgi:hypothetical protein
MRHPLTDLRMTWDPDYGPPHKWRDIAFVAAGSLLEIAKALHRIATVLEAFKTRQERQR